MVLKVSWIKILFIKLTNSSKHSLLLAKTGIEVHLMHEIMPPESFLVLSQRNILCPFGFAPHTLRVKLVFRVVTRHFVAAPGPL